MEWGQILGQWPRSLCFNVWVWPMAVGLRIVVLNLGCPVESSGELYKMLMPGPPPESLECSLGIGIFQSSPDDPTGQPRLGITGEARPAAW